MRWGDVVLVDLNPVVGSEANSRPAVVVSNDGANRAVERFSRGVITVAPITSNVANVYPFQVRLGPELTETGLTSESKVQVEQIRAVDMARVGQRLGRLPASLHEALREALLVHLGLRSGRSS